MAFGVHQDLDHRIFRLMGELDLSTCNQLIEQLEPAAQSDGDLHLDVAALEFIDSSGIRALITLCKRLEHRGRVILQSPTTHVARVLALVRADTFPNLVIEIGMPR